MPSEFDGLVGELLFPELYEVFAQPLAYRPAGDSSAQSVAGVVDFEMRRFGEDARVSGKTAVVSVRASEVPDRPRRGDEFELEDGTVLRVDNILRSDGYEHECACL